MGRTGVRQSATRASTASWLVHQALIDDASIALSYAWNLATRLQWGLIPTESTNSATSPLNVLLLATAAALLRLGGVSPAWGLELVFVGSTVALTWGWPRVAIAPEIAPGRSAWRSSDQPHGLLAIAASIGESLSHLFTAEGQQRLYRLVMYRDLPVRIDSYDYTLYIRNDLVPLYNEIRY